MMNAPPAQPPLLTVALALYNEKESLRQSVTDILAAKLPGDWRLELLIIDDGSTDGSSAIADDLAANHTCIRVIRHFSNQGLGPVYRTGFESARGDWLSFLPADGQYPASELLRLLAANADERADLVLGLLPQGRESFIGHLLSRLERLLFRVLFGSPPPFQGIFLVRTEKLRKLTLHSRGRGWAIVLEMIIRADRARCRWINEPIHCLPRQAGKSKVNNLRMVVLNSLQLLKLRWLLWVKPNR